MLFALLADVVLVIHFAFVAFVIGGGVLALRWPRLAWFHLPVLAWGIAIEFAGFICPLTPLENELRHSAGGAGYSGGFIDHYITATIYPSGLTRGAQIVLGVLLVAGNAAIYARLLTKRRR
ncbi:MAG: DUF2784 domain-containing protein [Gemmatimonadales bacterium]